MLSGRRPETFAIGYQHRGGFPFRPADAGTGFRPGQRAASARPVSWGQNQPEAVVVVAVVGGVPVAVRRPAVPGVVVPAAAAKHPALP